MQRLTYSQLNYMLCICQLTNEGKVRSTDLSRQIGLSMPSVHNMLVTLTELKLVEKDAGSIHITLTGQESLDYYRQAMDSIRVFLTGVGAADCSDDIMVMATALSPDTLERIMTAYPRIPKEDFMIPIWMANPGEDFRIDKVKRSMSLITATGKELNLTELEGCVLPITAKTSDSIYGVFHGHRIVFDRKWAMEIRGTILGRTREAPVIIAPDGVQKCTGNCKSCGGCK